MLIPSQRVQRPGNDELPWRACTLWPISSRCIHASTLRKTPHGNYKHIESSSKCRNAFCMCDTDYSADACKVTYVPHSALHRSDYMLACARAKFNIPRQGNETHKEVLFFVSGQREMNSGDFAIYCLRWAFLHISPLPCSLSLTQEFSILSLLLFFSPRPLL